jgi:hypothetical protein
MRLEDVSGTVFVSSNMPNLDTDTGGAALQTLAKSCLRSLKTQPPKPHDGRPARSTAHEHAHKAKAVIARQVLGSFEQSMESE